MGAKDNGKSVVWINTYKALCIIGVFYVHCQINYGYWVESTNLFVHTFYVNAFFCVSGYLLFWKQLSSPKIDEDKALFVSRNGGGKALLNNVLFRIVIPSILFSVMEFFPSCIIQDRGIDIEFALYKTIGGGTYWFTSALVVAELILLMLFCTRKRNIWFYATVCLASGVAGLMIVQLDILKSGIWAWRQGLIALIFLAMGGLYWRYEKQVDKLMCWWIVLPLLMVYVAMIVGLKDYTDPLISTLTIQPLGVVTSAIACLLLVWLCKKMPEAKPMTFVGQNSLGFYFMSGALPISLSLVAKKALSIWPLAVGDCLVLLVLWITCLLVAYLVVLLINRRLPWLWNLRVLRKQDK